MNNLILSHLIPIIISVSSLLVLCIIVFLVIIFIRKKPKKIIIDDEFINTFIEGFGGLDNIKSLNNENGGRLSVEVNDVDLLLLDIIKSIAVSGVFITGNVVKTLYREDSLIIKNSIEERIKKW